MTIINSLFSDPRGTLLVLLLALPGRIIALSVHEFAHAWVANRCGDPTAKMLGRLSLNPMRHIDPLGMVMMLLVGFGWAKPVPVNPRNYRNYRRDDLLVSIAGVTMNLIMFLLSMILMTLFVSLTLQRIPDAAAATADSAIYRMNYNGTDAILLSGSRYYYSLRDLLQNLPFVSDILIAPVYGEIVGYLYQMFGYFALTNLVLFVFNLIPVPPLDGYHVLNDLVLHRNLFANVRTAQIMQGLMFVLAISGVMGRALSWVDTAILSGAGNVIYALIA